MEVFDSIHEIWEIRRKNERRGGKRSGGRRNGGDGEGSRSQCRAVRLSLRDFFKFKMFDLVFWQPGYLSAEPYSLIPLLGSRFKVS